ncbi:MAG: gamma carbonic anhydrase family protein [Nitrospinae bacterium]|nr:gamma carbonic anhydrase family protein [Nitrospinota bacterium]
MIKPYKGILPKIHHTAFIEDSAQIIGDVEIGEDSSIWFNTVVRGDVHYIRIGKRVNIQDGSVIHVTNAKYPSVVEDEVTVGHGVILHGCTVKSHSLIGMGAIVMDNSVISSEVIVAAGSVVAENTVIESGWLALGVPAKPKRRLSKDEIAWIHRSVNNYVEYKNDYIA